MSEAAEAPEKLRPAGARFNKRPVLTLAELAEISTEAEGRLDLARAAGEAAETALAEIARRPDALDDELSAAVLARNEARASVEIAEHRLAGIRTRVAEAEVAAAAVEVQRYQDKHVEAASLFSERLLAIEDAILDAAEAMRALDQLSHAASWALRCAQGTAAKHGLAVPNGVGMPPRIGQLLQIAAVAEAVRMSRSARTPKSAA